MSSQISNFFSNLCQTHQPQMEDISFSHEIKSLLYLKFREVLSHCNFKLLVGKHLFSEKYVHYQKSLTNPWHAYFFHTFCQCDPNYNRYGIWVLQLYGFDVPFLWLNLNIYPKLQLDFMLQEVGTSEWEFLPISVKIIRSRVRLLQGQSVACPVDDCGIADLRSLFLLRYF